MEPGDSWLVLAFLICLGLSAFFSSAEAAFLALPKFRLMYLVESGVKGAGRLATVAEKPERFLATVLLGNNLVNIAAATLGTIMAVKALGVVKGPIVATLGVTALVLIFGEVIPKTIAVHHAERLSLIYAGPLKMMELCLSPFVLALSRIGLGFTKMLAEPREERKLVSEGEIRSAINAGESQGVVEEHEAEMLHKIFEFTDRPVSKIMVPRTEITWVEQGTKIKDFLELYAKARHSRYPVYKDNTDNVIGVLHVKDVLLKLSDASVNREDVIDDLVRPAHFVPESKRLGRLLTEMRDGGYHAVLVVDEYGGIAGMVTLGQLTEEIVGDIRDELEQEHDFVVTGESTFELDGGLRISEVKEKLGLELPPGDYETIAGFILSHLGRIPKEGEQFRYQDLKLVIAEMRGMRIARIIATRERDATVS